LPRLLYASLPGFVPRLDFGEKQALDPGKAPFFKHGAAQYWIAWRGDQPVGRISAQVDQLQDDRLGMFGCLDAADDPETLRALLAQAEEWLSTRGKTLIRGPFTLSINGESGLLVEGQRAPSMTMMPWHPAYLKDHLAASGFSKVKELLSYAIDLRGVDLSKIPAAVKTPRLSAAIRLRGLDMKNLESEAKTIVRLFNDAWRNNWGFAPLTDDEVLTLTHAFHIFLVPECCVFVEFEGAPVAVALVLPNLAELTGDFHGRLVPFNWARLLFRAWRKDYRSGRLVLLGVAKHVRNSIVGAVAPFAMIAEFTKYGERYPLVELEASWVLEDNRPVRAILERFGGRINRRYAVFEKLVSGTGR